MADTDFQSTGKTGSVFLLVLIFYGFISFLYLAIKSIVVDNSVLGSIIAVTFMIMMLVSLIFTGKQIMGEEKDLVTSTLGFFGGLVLIFIIAWFSKLMLLLNKQSLMSLISSQLTASEDFRLNVISVPVAEELLWLITIPMFVVLLLNAASNWKKLGWMENKWVQLVVVILVSGSSFALFHVGQINGSLLDKVTLTFLVSAFIFRAILLILVSEPGEKAIKWLDVTTMAAIGAHIGNNWATYVFGTPTSTGIGFFGTIMLLTQDFWGILFLIILAIFGSVAIYNLWDMAKEKWF